MEWLSWSIMNWTVPCWTVDNENESFGGLLFCCGWGSVDLEHSEIGYSLRDDEEDSDEEDSKINHKLPLDLVFFFEIGFVVSSLLLYFLTRLWKMLVGLFTSKSMFERLKYPWVWNNCVYLLLIDYWVF